MRVLFTTFAWPSHFTLQVPQAWALQATGHEVRMTSQPALMPTMCNSGLPATAVGRDLDVVAGFRDAADPAERSGPVGTDEQQSLFRPILTGRVTGIASRESRHGLFARVAESMVDDLLALARSWRPDLVVYDPVTYAGPLVAKLIGVPAVRNLFGPDITYFSKVTREVPDWAALLDRFGVDDIDLLGTASVDSCPPSLQFPADVVPTHRIHTRHIPYHGLSEIPQWLSDRPTRTRICLTWGTSTDRLLGGDAFLPNEVLHGATKLADERDAELVLAITAGQRHLLPDLPPAVRIVESVPLSALLATCDAIIHQGGTGTMLTAVTHGLPQLVVPQLVDQAANASRVVATGAGRTLAASDLTASDLLDACHALLDDPAYRIAAGDLRQENLDQPPPAAVVEELAALV